MNGSGKTTLLRTLVNQLPVLAGEVYQQPRALPAEPVQKRQTGVSDDDRRVEVGVFSMLSCSILFHQSSQGTSRHIKAHQGTQEEHLCPGV